jgi:hypothetical protein
MLRGEFVDGICGWYTWKTPGGKNNTGLPKYPPLLTGLQAAFIAD